MYLRARRKWGIIEGNVTKPDDASLEIDDWRMVRSMSISWIMNTTESGLRTTVTYNRYRTRIMVRFKRMIFSHSWTEDSTIEGRSCRLQATRDDDCGPLYEVESSLGRTSNV